MPGSDAALMQDGRIFARLALPRTLSIHIDAPAHLPILEIDFMLQAEEVAGAIEALRSLASQLEIEARKQAAVSIALAPNGNHDGNHEGGTR